MNASAPPAGTSVPVQRGGEWCQYTNGTNFAVRDAYSSKASP